MALVGDESNSAKGQEKIYPRSADDRALCGLSMGSMTTNKMVSLIPETFRYYGAFSGGFQNYTSSDYDVNKINGATYYITADIVYRYGVPRTDNDGYYSLMYLNRVLCEMIYH